MRIAAAALMAIGLAALPAERAVGSDTIGAVGSAGSTLETDDPCAKAGIAAVADQLK